MTEPKRSGSALPHVSKDFSTGETAMLSLKSFFAAFAVLLAAPMTLAPAAMAQGTNVVVIDRAQVLVQSKAGQDMQTKLQALGQSINSELVPTANALVADRNTLNTKAEGKTEQAILADAALTAEFRAYATKAQAFKAETNVANQELALTERAALIQFNQALVPVLQAVIAETGANIILDQSQVIFVDDTTDATASVIAKLDAATPTISVVRQKVPAPQPQQ